MSYTIKILPKDINVEVEQGTSLLDVQIKAALHPDAPCGGQGTCGKCLVDVQLEDGTFETVKACQTFVEKDLTIRTKEETAFHVLTSGTKRSFTLNPAMSLEEIKAKKALGAAFDIGTTSVVCYLLDLETGEELAHASMLNPQSQFGADVISRCEYAIANGVDTLSTVIHTALNELLNEACKNAGRAKEEIYIASIVGNTCMHHLYLGINPQSLTVVPYEATVKDEMVVKPEEVELEINKDGIVQILPNIAGFVGADTVGCLLATAFDEIEEMTLMIDIGTNGEMVMGNKNHMIACSTAAGPAFEGAKIECGMRGKDGAIDHIKASVDGKNLVCHVIDDVAAEGICGSGLMDAIAVGLDIELIDESGKISDDFDYVYKNDENLRAFKLRDGVYLSQKDVREVQLAKGAIAAGIELMAEKLGIQVNDIKKVMIAGAFGNYMDPHSACRIGMIPAILEDRIEMIGNAAGEGSRIATLNKDEFVRAQAIKENIEFLELASSPNFQDTFVDNLLFE